jgi:hypothetical protein
VAKAARAILACFLVGASPASWADATDVMLVIGMGNNGCGPYLQAVEGERKARPVGADAEQVYSASYAAYVDFADGFLSGANNIDAFPRRMVGASTSRAGRMLWIENYCRAQPLARFGGALLALRAYLAKQGL